MKKFRFRLNPLLVLKKMKEDEEIRNFSKIVSEINLLREEQDSLYSEINTIGNSISAKIGMGASIQDYNEYSDTSRYLNLKISQLEEDIQTKQPELDLARIRLNEASKEKKVLEILKKQEWKLHRKKMQKEEKKELEEYITIQHFMESKNQEGEFPVFPKSDQTEWDDWERKSLEQDEVTEEKKELSEYEKLKEYYDSFQK